MITQTDGRPQSSDEELPPFPEGWYFVAHRDSILREKLIEKTWMGQEIVVWCDDEGRICVSDAYCPHLGSHLGPTVGGAVRDGCLVCPFHGFQFDATGQCVATPHAPVGATLVEGAYLRSCFDFKNVRRIAGPVNVVVEVSAVTHVHGLGYSLVEFHEKTISMDSRLWVLATPVDGTLVEVVLVSQVREIRKPGRFFAGLRFLPVAMRHRVMNRIVLSEERRFVLQDVVIWERKKYQAPPRLSQADGPVGKYRQYSRQFYPELESERRPTLRAI